MSAKPDPKFQHDGLPDAGLRDFLSRGLETAHKNGGTATYGGHEAILKEIARLELALEASKQIVAIEKVAEMKGWKFVDTSDHVIYGPEWFMFLGTEAELATKFPELAEERASR